MKVPTVDFSQFLHGNETQRLAASVALVESFSNHGFVKLINHGVVDASISELVALVSFLECVRMKMCQDVPI